MMKTNIFCALSCLALLSIGCNIPASVPVSQTVREVTPPVTLTIPPIESTVPATNADVTLLTPTASASAAPPTPTLTLFYMPTITSTPSWAECPLIVTANDTSAGDILHIRRCEDNLEYDLGPFAKGLYAVGPNQKFIVYVTNNGLIYAAKIGQTFLTLIKNVQKERVFIALNKGAPPIFSISFEGEQPYYKVVLMEKKFQQRYLYNIPTNLVE